MLPFMFIVIPYFHDFTWDAPLEILKDSLVESCSDWILRSCHGFMVVVNVAWIEMAVVELGIG
jgi:hypothetical protein